MTSAKDNAGTGNPYGNTVDSDPTKCPACGGYWVTPEGKWNVCVDCPYRTVKDVETKEPVTASVSIDVGLLIEFLQTLRDTVK